MVLVLARLINVLFAWVWLCRFESSESIFFTKMHLNTLFLVILTIHAVSTNPVHRTMKKRGTAFPVNHNLKHIVKSQLTSLSDERQLRRTLGICLVSRCRLNNSRLVDKQLQHRQRRG